MNKIFENKQIENNGRKNRSPFPILRSKEEYQKDREIRALESLYKKKLSKEYVDKLSVLLYNSKNKLNYSQKRNNIKKTIYKLDDNNELYLTLPKLKVKNKQKGLNNIYTKTETTREYTNNKITSIPSSKKYYDDEEVLDENIKEILYEDQESNNNSNKKEKEEEEEKGKLLYEKLRTRYDSFDYEDNTYRSNEKEKKTKYKSLPKLKKKQIPSEYKLIATPQQISEFDYNLGRSFVNGNLRYLTKLQKEKLGYIAELNLFNSIDRLKEKDCMIKEMKSGTRNKKNYLMPIDFFKYNAEKWKKISNERNKNYNDIAINQLNEENKGKLDLMKENVNKLNIDAFVADKEVNKTINNINYFLSKYGIDSTSSHSSKKSIRQQPTKKKEKKVVNEEIILKI